MSPIDRKARRREYKESPQPAGIYLIRNTSTGRALVGSTVNLAGRLNRHRFQLKMGSHPVAALQKDWKDLGETAFEFTILDHLEPREEPGYDPRAELDTLRELWLERLGAEGAELYGAVTDS
jgi:GIY-YIG catalytic domain